MTVIPKTAAELEDALSDRSKVEAAIADGSFFDTVKAYAASVVEKDANLAVQVREQATATVTAYFKDHADELLAHRPTLTPADRARNHGPRYNPKALGAQLDGQFSSLGDVVAMIAGERRGEKNAMALANKIRNDFSSTIPSEGGFLIPEEWRSQMLETAQVQAIVRPRATVIPVSSPHVKMPMIEDTDHTAGIAGGILTFWEAEGATLQASAPKWGEVAMDANNLTAYAEIPNTLLSDSAISLEGFVNTTFPKALVKGEDRGFLFGPGAGMPLGVFNAQNTAKVEQAKETSQVAATIVWENLIKMFARLLPESHSNAVWLASPDTFPELATMALSIGTAGSAVWLGNGVGSPPVSILGRPVIFSERMPKLGQAGDIALCDLSYYLIADLEQALAMWSPHFRFSTNTTAYRIIQRLDGRPWLKNPITPENSGPTLSPFVTLAAR